MKCRHDVFVAVLQKVFALFILPVFRYCIAPFIEVYQSAVESTLPLVRAGILYVEGVYLGQRMYILSSSHQGVKKKNARKKSASNDLIAWLRKFVLR